MEIVRSDDFTYLKLSLEEYTAIYHACTFIPNHNLMSTFQGYLIARGISAPNRETIMGNLEGLILNRSGWLPRMRNCQ